MERRDFRQKGQSLVEFALVLPLLALFIVGVFDLGYSVFINNEISNAAREGARVGVVRANGDDAIRARVRATTPGLNLPNSQIDIAPAVRVFNSPITVTVTYIYTPMTPIVANIAPSLRLSSTSVMIVEGVDTGP